MKTSSQENYYMNTLDNFRDSELFNERIDPENPDAEQLNTIVFYLTNEIRLKLNLSFLTYNKLLEESSILHSKSMVKYGYFGHINRKKKAHKNPIKKKLWKQLKPLMVKP